MVAHPNQRNMLKLPDLPLTNPVRELVDFCLDFQTTGGFIAVYETKLAELNFINPTKKRGLKTAAYEATEQLYCQVLNRGRRFVDAENFFNAQDQYKRRQNRKL